ncbi:MAG: type IVB secretion system apparatus protein IcmL/DotI [Gammaproteobacteria bacterium]|nr:type IVB secretion system apparatus protein IcmL/DotI [Gammaproteobacteria bacterium]
MVDDAIEMVRLRNNFYRDNYRRLVGGLLISLIIVIGLVGTVVYQITNRPEPRYFATTVDGRIMPLYALSEAMLSPGELLQWAHGAAIAAYTYNFVNYRDAMQQLQNQFTPKGWVYYEDALRASRNLEMVIAKKLVVSAVATGTPVILDQAVIDGRYSWKVQIPLLVSYQSPNEQTQNPVIVMMIISRVPTVDMPKGIAIVSFVASEGNISR